MQQWPMELIDHKLHETMAGIHRSCTRTAHEFGQPHTLGLRANIAGFRKGEAAMIEQAV